MIEFQAYMQPTTTLKSAFGRIVRPFILTPLMIKDRFPIFMFHRIIEASEINGLDEHLSISRRPLGRRSSFSKKHQTLVFERVLTGRLRSFCVSTTRTSGCTGREGLAETKAGAVDSGALHAGTVDDPVGTIWRGPR